MYGQCCEETEMSKLDSFLAVRRTKAARRPKPHNIVGLFKYVGDIAYRNPCCSTAPIFFSCASFRSIVVRGMPTARDNALAEALRPVVCRSNIFRKMIRSAKASHVLTPG